MNVPSNPLNDTDQYAISAMEAITDVPGDCGRMLAGLYHFLDGELTQERRVHIQAHLDGCPTCFGAFDFEAELRIVVRSRVQLRVPEALIQKIRIAIRNEPLG